MSGHEQFAEDLALYALNALEGEDRANLEKHLATCGACRLELEQLRGDGALLALSVMGPKPPQRSRQRLLEVVAKESAQAPTLSQKARKDGHPVRVDHGGDSGDGPRLPPLSYSRRLCGRRMPR
jgi:anti-sigma factor RsiW